MSKKYTLPGQAMLEFALAIPIVMLLVIGMFEVGRLIVYNSAVTSAARDAVRYGAVTGKNPNNNIVRYCDVDNIRAAAANAGFFAGVQGNTTDTIITYDTGPGSSPYNPCANGAKLLPGTRILVKVVITYTPSINFPASNVGRPVTSTSARTILGKQSMP